MAYQVKDKTFPFKTTIGTARNDYYSTGIKCLDHSKIGRKMSNDQILKPSNIELLQPLCEALKTVVGPILEFLLGSKDIKFLCINSQKSALNMNSAKIQSNVFEVFCMDIWIQKIDHVF